MPCGCISSVIFPSSPGRFIASAPNGICCWQRSKRERRREKERKRDKEMTVVWTIVCFVFRQKRYELWCRKSDRLLSALGGRIDVAEQHRLGDGNHARTREMIRTERCGIPAGSSRYNDAHRGRHKSSPHGIHNRCNLCTIAWVGPLDQTSLTRRLKTNTRNTGRVLLSRSSDCFPPFQFWYLRCLFFFILFYSFSFWKHYQHDSLFSFYGKRGALLFPETKVMVVRVIDRRPAEAIRLTASDNWK